MTRELPPPTDDDVSITLDGVRLDTKEKVIAFIEQLESEHSAVEAGSVPGR